MAANDEYIGWTAWAAGPLWGTISPCCTDTKQYGSLEPGSRAGDGSPGYALLSTSISTKCGLLMKSCDVRRLYETVWLKAIQPLVPSMLQWSGVSSVKGGTLTSGPGKKYSGRYGRK